MKTAFFNRDGSTWVGIPLWVADVLENRDIAYYVFAASHADNETGEFTASYRTIAAEMGVNHKTVGNAMRRMVKLGILESKPTRRVDGYKGTNLHRFSLTAPAGWVDPRERVRLARESASKWTGSEVLGNENVPQGGTESRSKVEPESDHLTRPIDIDSINGEEKHVSSSSEIDTHTRRQAVKRTSIGVSAETRREGLEFVARFRRIDPTLGGELVDHIVAIYADECNKRELEHRQIMAALERYGWAKEDEYFEYDDQRFKKPTAFLRQEVMPGVDYVGASGDWESDADAGKAHADRDTGALLDKYAAGANATA